MEPSSSGSENEEDDEPSNETTSFEVNGNNEQPQTSTHQMCLSSESSNRSGLHKISTSNNKNGDSGGCCAPQLVQVMSQDNLKTLNPLQCPPSSLPPSDLMKSAGPSAPVNFPTTSSKEIIALLNSATPATPAAPQTSTMRMPSLNGPPSDVTQQRKWIPLCLLRNYKYSHMMIAIISSIKVIWCAPIGCVAQNSSDSEKEKHDILWSWLWYHSIWWTFSDVYNICHKCLSIPVNC